MLREIWNFKNDIGLRVETKARNYFGETDRPKGKIYDSDWIENGHFVEVMIILLRGKTEYELGHEEIDTFIAECATYLGKSANEIPDDDAQAMFNKFIELYDEDENQVEEEFQ